MAGVTYSLADFVTGRPILDLPVMPGASWAVQLNRPDALSCSVDLRDEDNRKLDIRSATEPDKTVLYARTDADVVLAWGLIQPTREWDEDAQTLSLDAVGVTSSWLGRSIIGPASAKTAALVVDDEPNPALDTSYDGFSLGTLGKKLVAQRLAWPGSPTQFVLPADEIGTHEGEWLFSAFENVGKALDDLADLQGGPDFAFDAQRASNGRDLLYVMRHGSEATPRIGAKAGTWALGGASPISGFRVGDDGVGVASAAWLSAGKQSGTVILSRAINDALLADGYPPTDDVDTSHNTVRKQTTLDRYAAEAIDWMSRTRNVLKFSVRADANPGLGAFRPGDTVTLDIPDDHAYLPPVPIEIRITSIKGDERGLSMQIGCVILDG
jgi:hypothetical protein